MVDFNKPVQTRDRRKARVYSMDGGGTHPIHGAIWEKGPQRWRMQSWQKDGCVLSFGSASNGSDLINALERQVGYLNVYPPHLRSVGIYTTLHPTRGEADREAGEDRISCVRIQYQEGQFDE